MKKGIVSTLLVMLFSAASFSQTNTYFSNNPMWQITSSCALPDQQCVRNEIYNYYLKGDTTINSLVYKNVFKKGYVSHTPKFPMSLVNCPGSYHYKDSVPSYFLRSAGNQVFVRLANEPTESLLYDFNLNVGDTLPQTYNSWQTDITVAAIDYIATADGYRKRYALSNNTHINYLIEGVGHSQGLFEPLGPVFDCGYFLDCFSMNDIAYFPTTGSSCDLAVGIVTREKRLSFSVSPNPFVSRTILQFSATVTRARLNIYNQYGQLVRILKDISGDSIVVERGVLSSGIYFFDLIETNRSNVKGKLIITD